MAKRLDEKNKVGSRRYAFFTHDTFGLGHVRRTMRIVNELARQNPDAAILVITGSPALHVFKERPRNVDVIKIPTIARTGAAESRPPHLPIPVDTVSQMRSRLILEALATFEPHVFLVDNFPLGSRRELLPSLEHLHTMGTRIVAGLRDILDYPSKIEKNWRKDGIYDALDRYFDAILCYGSRDILDIAEVYGFSETLAKKLSYCGYVTERAPSRPAEVSGFEILEDDKPLVVATVGGGGDGFPVVESFIPAMSELTTLSGLVVTGPLMGATDRERVDAMAVSCANVQVVDFVADLPGLMRRADLVVSMGGYNTLAEIMACGCRAIVVPRNWRYGEHAVRSSADQEWEQLMRAQAMDRLGLCRCVTPDALNPGNLRAEIERSLTQPRSMGKVTNLDGANRVARELATLALLEETDGLLV